MVKTNPPFESPTGAMARVIAMIRTYVRTYVHTTPYHCNSDTNCINCITPKNHAAATAVVAEIVTFYGDFSLRVRVLGTYSNLLVLAPPAFILTLSCVHLRFAFADLVELPPPQGFRPCFWGQAARRYVRRVGHV